MFFEKGQEVNEIRSISLDPDISIQPFNDYISIRGIVELSGEYEKNSLSEDDSSLESLTLEDTSQSLRYVEKVKDMDGGLSTFHHRFPIEISVPSYRVNNLEDVTVKIASFDYQLPDPSQIKLLSTIEIHGIDEDVVDPSSVPVNREDEEELVNKSDLEITDRQVNEDDVEDSFAFEIKQQPKINEDDEQEVDIQEERLIQEQQEEKKEEEEEQEEDTKNSSENKEETTNEEGRWKKTHSQTLSEFFESEKETNVESNESNKKDDSLENQELITDAVEQDLIDSSDNEEELDQELSDSDSNETETLPLRYLSELFRDEEEQFTRMRLYIVQDEDTLSSIADRYETTTMHIIKQNRLNEETVAQGQLLYVPYNRKS